MYCLVFVCGLLLFLVWFAINCGLTCVLVLLRLIVFVVRFYLVVAFGYYWLIACELLWGVWCCLLTVLLVGLGEVTCYDALVWVAGVYFGLLWVSCTCVVVGCGYWRCCGYWFGFGV